MLKVKLLFFQNISSRPGSIVPDSDVSSNSEKGKEKVQTEVIPESDDDASEIEIIEVKQQSSTNDSSSRTSEVNAFGSIIRGTLLIRENFNLN